MISVLILTLNEEADIGSCLESISWCKDIVVVDSGSIDRTVEIAKAAGASVFYNEFRGYASQRNFGLNRQFKFPWVLILDADERTPVQFHECVRQFVLTTDDNVVAAEFRRRDYWNTSWLKRSQISPLFTRLVRPEFVRYEREINERLLVDGRCVHLECHFDHFPFSKGIGHWIAKHNAYSTMEAREANNVSREEASLRKALFHSSFIERRKHQKRLFFRLPLRPLVKVFYMLFIRGGILDGIAGVQYAFLQAIYEYFIVLKQAELRKLPVHKID